MSQQQNKSNAVAEASSNPVESASAASPTWWNRFTAKKWAFPAMYMVAAAIILTLMWAYQDSAKQAASTKPTQTDLAKANGTGDAGVGSQALPVAAAAETMSWPVKDKTEYEVSLPFYDNKGTADAQQAAMIEYNDTFTPHVGIDFARSDNQTFDVLAAASGQVTAVDQNALVGNLVEITQPNGIVTVYQSLDNVKVAKGDQVKKGATIAQAGRNELEKDEGYHLHFEVRQNGQAVDPNTVISDSSK